MTATQLTRRAKAAYSAYLKSDMKDIRKAYVKPSNAKISAWAFHQHSMGRYNGYDMRVISKNCQFFTCGFCYIDKKTKLLNFVYITPNYTATVEAINESILNHHNA